MSLRFGFSTGSALGLVSWGCPNTGPKTRWVKTTQSGGQGVGRRELYPRTQGERILLWLPASVAGGSPCCPELEVTRIRGLLWVRVFVQESLLYKDSNPID